ncbi:MAG: 3-oxoacyl-[Lachnospiraceae bacterium]|nr:3-oxoacyl-[acyl-carrier-protein] reductase [Lachnospiraceae bacterium]MBR6469922.1 3-oxoacyl-[acyl-carrier-protein] reductase [Lachnospiraceae bacterium]
MLKDKVALVTGASRGIGAEVAKTLAGHGAFVYVNYNGSKSRADEVVDEIVKAGGAAEAIQCDVADFDSCREMIDKIIADKGRLDILVNNAGITRDDLLMKMSEEAFDAVISTNLKGCFNTIRHASRYLLKQRSGKIINMSSVSGVMGNAGQANYSAAKAGVVGLTKSVAKELSSRGINCNAIAPGFIETEMTAAMTDKAKEATIAMIPLGRTGKVSDIAGAVLFLASDMSDYITGQVLSVDGGMNI